MRTLIEVVGLVVVVVAVSAAARRLGVLAPILLVVVGLVLSFVPQFPVPEIDPELVIVGILPPLLYVAAIEMSVPAFRFNLRPILLLAVGHVLFIAAAVGFVVHALSPGIPLAACLALGAVVAPPDAIAATAVARRIGLPRRIVVLLEGESLLNDATAIVTFRVAVAAAVGTAIGPTNIAVEVGLAVGGGIGVGVVGAWLFRFLHQRAKTPLMDNSLSLLTPFVVALGAEAVHGSGVVAVVVAGLYLGHRMPTLMSAASRLQMNAFWQMIKFLLEGLVFLAVGLQLRHIAADLDTGVGQVVLLTATVLAVVIVLRIIWLLPATYGPWMLRRTVPRPAPSEPLVIGWAGMRGVVTLATALALPATLAGGQPWQRELFVWLAFAVIVCTLVVQGTTLPAVARLAKLPPDDPIKDRLAEAQIQNDASQAARRRLDQLAESAPQEVVAQLRQLAEQRSNAAWEQLGRPGETPTRAYTRLRREMLEAEREVFRLARDEGRIPEEVLVRTQRELDLEESMLERSEQP